MHTRMDAPSAMRAAPVLSSRNCASLCDVPSGKMAMAPPRDSRARASVNVARFDSVGMLSCRRYTGIESNARASHPINGILNNGALAMNDTRRGVKARRKSGSIRPFG